MGEMRRQRQWWWGMMLVLAGCLAGCGGPSPASTASKTPTAATPTTVLVATSAPSTLTPVAGDYSLYADPTWAYTFLYPSNWVVYPQSGNQESNVIISEPYNPSPDHAMVRLLVRVTSNFQHQFVQQYLCNQPTTTSVAGFDAVDLSTSGGNPDVGYSAMVMGRGFFAKGLAFVIWFQGSQKSYQSFLDGYKAIFQRIIASFNVGTGGQTAATCS